MIKIENILSASFAIIAFCLLMLLLWYGGIVGSLTSLLFVEISFTISPYSPINHVAIPLYQMLQFSLLVFALILLSRLHNIVAKRAAMFLALSSIVGVLLVYFPMDEPGGEKTWTGMAHVWIAALMSIAAVMALFLFAQAFKETANLGRLAWFSRLIGYLLLVSGGLTIIFALLRLSPWVALMERLPMVAFFGWILVTGVGMLWSDKRVRYPFFKD
jgi:hypothetical protein